MMGRKTGPPPGSSGKAPTSSQRKTGEVTKGLKRQQRKPSATSLSNSMKKKPVKSKPGFTLYSATSKTESVAEGAAGPYRGGGKHAAKSEQVAAGNTEVVSQVQLQEERAKSMQASSLYIPTADHEESIPRAESEDFMVSTPFNKRLVSSTPDPERLMEAELQDQRADTVASAASAEQGMPSSVQLRDDSPQMIPERDVATTGAPLFSLDARLLAPVAKGLSERVRRQQGAQRSKPQHFREADLSTEKHNSGGHKSQHSPSNQTDKAVPPWKQKHQKWKQELEKFKTASDSNQLDFREMNIGKIQDLTAASTNAAALFPIAKAEWVSDTHGAHSSTKETSTPHAPVADQRKKDPYHPCPVPQEFGHGMAVTSNPSTSSTEPSASAFSTPRVSSSSSGIHNTVSFVTPHGSLHSHDTPKTPLVPDYLKDYEHFKSGILKTTDNPAPQAGVTTPGHGPASTVNVAHFNPFLTQTITSHPQAATVTSTATHTQTVSSLGSAVKVSETVVGPELPRKPIFTRKTAPQKPKPASISVFGPKFKSAKENSETPSVMCGDTLPVMQIAKSPSNSQTKIPLETKEPQPIVIPYAVNTDSVDVSRDLENSDVSTAKNHTGSEDRGGKSEAGVNNHNTSYLSQVINLLKTDGFNAEKKDSLHKSESNLEHSETSDHHVDTHKVKESAKSESADDGLKEIMALYLPPNDNKFGDTQESSKNVSDNVHEGTASDTKDPAVQKDANNSNSGNAVKDDANQNYNSDDSSYDLPRRARKSRNLFYLENMADSTLRDIACRLAFKATALRDVELRDLIDDMIFHTDAALGHEDARFQSSHLFFQEENSKLKKRLHNVNRQLDAKERQEKMAATSVYSVSNNDMLHMERKMVYLRQEKDKLDIQVTTLLEEKARWLVTQQDLVRTISLKDHEIVKLEEKHHAEMTKLHQSLDTATQNSQGVHYKLSVADREISNMEQRLKCRDLDLADLREKLRQSELALGECRHQASAKDQEMLRLQDTVDTLKIGVDHVLQMFEAGASGLTTSEQQRQGMDSLYRMAHPERFSASYASEPGHPKPASQHHQQRPESEPLRQRGPPTSPTAYGPSTDAPVPNTTMGVTGRQTDSLPIRPEPRYPDWAEQTARTVSRDQWPDNGRPEDSTSWMQRRVAQRNQDGEQGQGRSYSRSFQEKQRSKDHRSESRLTAATLEEHNQRLSPIDRRLWRSMHESPVEVAAEPYYSDSEMELGRHDSQRFRRARPKSILKQSRIGRQRSREDDGRYREEDYPDRRDRMSRSQEYRDYRSRENERPQSSEKKKGRVRRKSESDKYSDYRKSSSYRELPRPRDLRPLTPRERLWPKSGRSYHQEAGEDWDESRLDRTDYFMKYSKMPPLARSPERGRRDDSQRERSQDRRDDSQRERSQDRRDNSQRQRSQDRRDNSQRQRSQDRRDDSQRERSQDRRDDSQTQRSQDRRDNSQRERSQDRRVDSLRERSQDRVQKDRRNDSQRERSQDRVQKASQSTKYSSIRSVPISKSSDNWADRESEKSSPATGYSTIRSRSLSEEDDKDLEEMDISSSPLDSDGVGQQVARGGSSRLQWETGNRKGWRGTRSPSPPSSRRIDQDRERDRRSASLEGRRQDSFRSAQDFDKTSLSHEQSIPFQTLEPDNTSFSQLPRQGSSKTRPRNPSQFSSHSDPGVGSSSRSRSQALSSQQSGPSSGEGTRGLHSDYATWGSNFPTQSSPLHLSDISVSRRATRGEDVTQRDFFQGTELSSSMSTIDDENNAAAVESTNNNQLTSLDEDPFSTGIASLDLKIAHLQKKIERAKAIFS